MLLRGRVQLVLAHRLKRADRAEHGAHVRHGVDDVAGSRLALRPDHRGAFRDPPQRLAEVRRTADERHGERPLVHVVLDVGRREDLGLVDVVDLERLEDLRLGEVPDPALGHHRDRDGLLDLLDLLGIAHSRDSPVAPDVCGDALERHHRAGAGLLGDARLLGVDDVHDDAALEHLGEARLDPQRPVLGHRRSLATLRVSRPLWIAARSSSKLRLSRCGNHLENVVSVRTMWNRYRVPARLLSPQADSPGPEVAPLQQGPRPPGALLRRFERAR